MTRLPHAVVALVAMVALLLAGPIGSGGVAAAAPAGGHGSPLERALDKLTPAERAQLAQQVTEQLEESGVHLKAPSDSSTSVVFLFIVAALLFLPSAFKVIGDIVFHAIGEVGGIEGLEPF